MNRTSRALRSTLVVSLLGYAARGPLLIAIPLMLMVGGAEDYGLRLPVMAFAGCLGFAGARLGRSSMILIADANRRENQEEIAHVVRYNIAQAGSPGAIGAHMPTWNQEPMTGFRLTVTTGLPA